MIIRKFSIRNWEVNLFVYIHSYYKKNILDMLAKFGASEEILKRVGSNIDKNSLNTGFTFSDKDERRSIIVIGRTNSGSEFLNSYCHELRHLVDDIAKRDDLEISGESVAYLSGDICNYVSDIVCKMSCSCCRDSV